MSHQKELLYYTVYLEQNLMTDDTVLWLLKRKHAFHFMSPSLHTQMQKVQAELTLIAPLGVSLLPLMCMCSSNVESTFACFTSKLEERHHIRQVNIQLKIFTLNLLLHRLILIRWFLVNNCTKVWGKVYTNFCLNISTYSQMKVEAIPHGHVA